MSKEPKYVIIEVTTKGFGETGYNRHYETCIEGGTIVPYERTENEEIFRDLFSIPLKKKDADSCIYDLLEN